MYAKNVDKVEKTSCDNVAPLIKRHFEHRAANLEQTLSKTTPKKFVPYTKLSSTINF